jgi:uncharacterized protein with HEPN domain
MIKPWQPYALHVLDAIDKIRRIETRGDITKDDILYDATLRNLQTLSEATQLLPQALKDRYPNVPWRQISGFRNILVHNYLGNIDPLTVAAVVKQHLQPLQSSVEDMLRNEGEDQDGD